MTTTHTPRHRHHQRVVSPGQTLLWQAPLDPNVPVRLNPLEPFRHQRVGTGIVHCPISERTEGTVRMEGQVCSYCARTV